MLNKIIHYSLHNRLVVVCAAILLLIAGTYTAMHTEVDVFPDLNAPTLVIMTEANGMAPEEVERLVKLINTEFGSEIASVELNDQYYNMREQIEPVMHIIDTAFAAMEAVGVKPNVRPIRGGTDGAQLSYKGLPCPNIFAGGLNFHGRYEFVPIQNMEKAMKVIVKIAELVASK